RARHGHLVEQVVLLGGRAHGEGIQADPVVGRHDTAPFISASVFDVGPASPDRVFGSSKLSVIATARDRTMFLSERFFSRRGGPEFRSHRPVRARRTLRFARQSAGDGLPLGVEGPGDVAEAGRDIGSGRWDVVRQVARPSAPSYSPASLRAMASHSGAKAQEKSPRWSSTWEPFARMVCDHSGGHAPKFAAAASSSTSLNTAPRASRVPSSAWSGIDATGNVMSRTWSLVNSASSLRRCVVSRLTYHSARTPAPASLSSTHTENGTSGGTILRTPRPRQVPSTWIRVGASARGRNLARSGTSCGLASSHPTIRVSPVGVPPGSHRTAPSGPSAMTRIGRVTSARSRSKSNRRNVQVTVSPGVQYGLCPTGRSPDGTMIGYGSIRLMRAVYGAVMDAR